ncbi:MAG TPA: cellulase family glycosylhydrolase [Pyrinomonadaceae bacterium]
MNKGTLGSYAGPSIMIGICLIWPLRLLNSLQTDGQNPSRPLSISNSLRTDVAKWDLWNGEIKLRGVNIWQRLVVKSKDGDNMGSGYIGPPYDSADFQKLKDWGANYVNISHPGIYFAKGNKGVYELDLKALENLRSLVTACGQKGLFVVISYRTGPERTEKKVFEDNKVSELWKKPEAQKAWELMWRKTAEEFRNSPYVVGYDLMVEPELKIRDPDKPDDKEKGRQWSKFANRLIKSIRDEPQPDGNGGAGDKDTPILVGGINMSDVDGLYVLDTDLIDPENNQKIVYAVHQYEPSRYTQQTEGKWSYDCISKRDLKGIPKPDQYKQYAIYETDPKLESQTLSRIYQRIKDWRASQQAQGALRALTINEFGVIRWAGSPGNPDGRDFLAKEFVEIKNLKANYALWKWDSHFCTGDDDYNFRHGQLFSHHDDIDDNPLAVLIRSEWREERNPLRP